MVGSLIVIFAACVPLPFFLAAAFFDDDRLTRVGIGIMLVEMFAFLALLLAMILHEVPE